ncbi:phage minor capsid protein [Streptomyces bambusae]|uniref:phage minor capsid protein n=1 Tax=Streptomyces bambusae TaxID=1550616 RepID=UPI001CFCBEFF|nr:phage minor capsid protein [Streptomyces bambusae]MCB5168006.1 phage minor capsid protein [Streptomyces bambusae]
MPVSPALAEDLAAAISMLYEDAELALIDILRRAVAEGIDSPRWAELKARTVGDLREAVEEVAASLEQDATGAVAAALAVAYDRGQQAAVAELGALDTGREAQARRVTPNAPAVDRLAASYAQDTRPLYQRITRSILDVFRTVTTQAAGTQLLTGQTRRAASQRALNAFAQRGVTGFVDRSGRSWELAAYAEMAVRSVAARAAIEGHIDALANVGVGLVIVSDAPLECPLCRPWEGKVLSLTGAAGEQTLTVEHTMQPGGLRALFQPPETVQVQVAGTLAEARGAGLFHPNCRHSLAAYLPGVTTRPPRHATPGTTYEDTQRQRAIERHIREWKRRQAAALDDDARARAGAYVRRWQAAAREHVAAHEHLTRKPAREQIGKAR